MLPWEHYPEQIHGHRNVLQLGSRQFFETRLERVPNLPFNVHRNADTAGTRERFDSRCDVDPIPIDIAGTMDHVADMDPYLYFNSPSQWDIGVAFGQRALDFDGTLRCF